MTDVALTLTPDGCQLWTGSTNAMGYGRVNFGGGRALVHRALYEQTHGPIPKGMVIDHLCRTPACVNLDHMEVVTIAENVRRGLRGRMITHCIHGHEYTPENTITRNTGRRECRTCVRARKRAANRAKKGSS